MLKVDPKMLVDTIKYSEYQGTDDVYQEAKYAEPIIIDYVRIDRNQVFSRDATQTKVIAEAVIFCFASATDPLPEFKEQSLIIFDGKEYILQRVITNKEPFQNVIFNYELEVL
ncbi:putative minor capsid protein [Vagococcus elongatus]|uniref:Minor capsid protein n=1 Tax=Vagococcus elongatus TaxID=180344 RepID=A0A430AU41_9ENTE|nr:putative minor capsid protein [Vagococcus elongatus]RSU11571.1 hypothetical protein CBF29_07775 [Vagococcus elongatus]